MDRLRQHGLPYVHNLERRALADVSLLVVHCTELPDLAIAREYAEKIHYSPSGTGNSGHFYIDRDGSVSQYVPLERIAHHVAGHNEYSVGVELVNLGRYPNWLHSEQQKMTEPYPQAQLDSLIALANWLKTQLPSLAQVAGHEDLDQRLVDASDTPRRKVHRKRDPGPLFPWPELIEAIGLTRMDPGPRNTQTR